MSFTKWNMMTFDTTRKEENFLLTLESINPYKYVTSITDLLHDFMNLAFEIIALNSRKNKYFPRNVSD